MTILSDPNVLQCTRFVNFFQSFWNSNHVEDAPFIADAAIAYFTAGVDFVYKPATIENLLSFFTAVARERWTKEKPVEEAIVTWSDAKEHQTSDPRMDIVNLMCMVNTTMRNGSTSSTVKVWRAVFQGWNPEMSVFELMCLAPIFF